MSNQAKSSQTEQAIEDAIEVIERFGGIRPMAKKMGVAVTTVQGWKKRNVIPGNRRPRVLEAATEHSIDLSDLLEDTSSVTELPTQEAPAQESSVGIANENHQETTQEAPEPQPQERITTPRPQASAFSAERHAGLDQKLALTERRAIKKSTWINAGLLVVGLIAVATILFGGSDDQRINSLEEDVTEIRQDVSDVKDQQSFLTTLIPENLDERINQIQEQAIEAQQKVNQAIATAEVISTDVFGEDGGTTIERAQKLNTHVKDLTGIDLGSYLGLEQLMQKFSALAQTQAGQDQLNQTMEELNAVFSTFQGSAESFDLTEQLQLAQENMPALNETFEDVPPEDLKAAALLLGMSQFRKSLNRDRTDFSSDLQVLKTIVGESDPELSASIDRLAPYSEQGVLTTDGLTNEFKTIAGDVIVASIKGEDVSIEDQIKGRIGEVLQVEKDGELLVGNDTQIKVNKAGDLLEQGDLASAVSLIEELDGPAAQAIAPWLKEAKATLGAQSLQNVLSNKISTNSIPSIGGGLIRDKTGSTNIYVPKNSIQNSVQKSIEEIIQNGGL